MHFLKVTHILVGSKRGPASNVLLKTNQQDMPSFAKSSCISRHIFDALPVVKQKSLFNNQIIFAFMIKITQQYLYAIVNEFCSIFSLVLSDIDHRNSKSLL
jgi:hypothetical protein